MAEKITREQLLKEIKDNTIFTDPWIANIPEERRYCFWYGGDIAGWGYSHNDNTYDVTISCIGDIYADLIDTATGEVVTHVKDRNNEGGFSEMYPLLKTDDDIEKALDQPHEPTKEDPYTFAYALQMDYNNWVEINVFNKTKKTWVEFGYAENICDPDDVFEAIEEAITNDLVAWVEECESEN